MGWGDEIMVTAEARKMQASSPMKVAVMDRRDHRVARWDAIWEGNPRIAHPDEVHRLRGVVQWMENYGGLRPYIDYDRSSHHRYAWAPYKPEPGEIYLHPDERSFGERHAGAIIIEPNVKSHKQINKDWGWDNWVYLTDLMPHLPWLQIGGQDTRMLPRCRFLKTSTTRLAAAVVAHARAVVTTEGGLHHCAAAFKVPGVVIFGGFIGPETTGYAMHENIFTGGTACGMRTPCQHCRESMKKITPEMVAEALMRVLKATDEKRKVAE